MKKLIPLLLALLLCVSVSAAPPRVVDEADLLYEGDEAVLEAYCEQIADELGFDVVIVTTFDTDGKSIHLYAADYLEQNYGLDGAILVIDIMARDWYFAAPTGTFTDEAMDYMEERIQSNLEEEDFFGSAWTFAEDCETFIRQARNGEEMTVPFDVGAAVIGVLICCGVGLAVGFIVRASLKSQLKSVYRRPEAGTYVVPGSLALAESRDMYLYSHISKVKIPENNNSRSGGSFSSSSGSSFSGRGGSF